MSRPEAVHALQVQVIQLGIALEALDTLLIEKGILKEDELVGKIKEVMNAKVAQVKVLDAN